MKDASISLKDVWPNERDYLARPGRYKYLRKEKKQKTCIFCDIFSSGVSQDSLCLYKTEGISVVVNKYPYNSGHLLVLPTKHYGDLSEMPRETVEAMSVCIQKIVKIVKKVYSCEGLNVGCNQGAVAGAGIPGHFHWHIIPRWMGDTNFFPLIGHTKLTLETPQQTYDKLFSYFKNGIEV